MTVVIPVYNAMPYLRRCLDSVLGQTIGLDRLQVVAVDDGSTDGGGRPARRRRRTPARTSSPSCTSPTQAALRCPATVASSWPPDAGSSSSEPTTTCRRRPWPVWSTGVTPGTPTSSSARCGARTAASSISGSTAGPRRDVTFLDSAAAVRAVQHEAVPPLAAGRAPDQVRPRPAGRQRPALRSRGADPRPTGLGAQLIRCTTTPSSATTPATSPTPSDWRTRLADIADVIRPTSPTWSSRVRVRDAIYTRHFTWEISKLLDPRSARPSRRPSRHDLLSRVTSVFEPTTPPAWTHGSGPRTRLRLRLAAQRSAGAASPGVGYHAATHRKPPLVVRGRHRLPVVTRSSGRRRSTLAGTCSVRASLTSVPGRLPGADRRPGQSPASWSWSGRIGLTTDRADGLRARSGAACRRPGHGTRAAHPHRRARPAGRGRRDADRRRRRRGLGVRRPAAAPCRLSVPRRDRQPSSGTPYDLRVPVGDALLRPARLLAETAASSGSWSGPARLVRRRCGPTGPVRSSWPPSDCRLALRSPRPGRDVDAASRVARRPPRQRHHPPPRGMSTDADLRRSTGQDRTPAGGPVRPQGPPGDRLRRRRAHRRVWSMPGPRRSRTRRGSRRRWPRWSRPVC